MHRPIFILSGLVLVLCAGCRTTPPLPPADFSAPGWHVQQGQAVWKPSQSRPELAGDLLLATNVNGNFFLQFSKMPFPLATARVSGDRWQIEFGADKYFVARSRQSARSLRLVSIAARTPGYKHRRQLAIYPG